MGFAAKSRGGGEPDDAAQGGRSRPAAPGFVRRTLPLGEELRRLREFGTDYAGDALHHQRRHGDVFYRRLGTPSLYLCHPELVRCVLRTKALNYVKGPDYGLLRPLLGQGILVSEGELWFRQRRLLAPEFRAKEVIRFLPVINAELALMFENWARFGLVDVNASMMRLTLRVLGGSMFRSDFSSLEDIAREAFETCLSQATKQMVSMGLLKPWLPTPGNLRAREAERALNEAVRELIARAHEPEAAGGCPLGTVDMVTRMLLAEDPDTGTRMSTRQLLDEVKSLILAGHETTALALSWTFYLLVQHPDVLARVVAEVREVLGGRFAEAGDVPRLVYTRQVLLEAMRLYPPVPAVTRTARADHEFHGIRVHAGESVTIPIYTIHRHLEFWPEPDRFDPDRFAPGHEGDIDPYCYMPFLRGRRACLGEHFAMLEAVVALASIVDRFEMRRIEHGEIGVRPVATLRATRPLIVRVRPREGAVVHVSRAVGHGVGE
jgi:cytochrome P450